MGLKDKTSRKKEEEEDVDWFCYMRNNQDLQCWSKGEKG